MQQLMIDTTDSKFDEARVDDSVGDKEMLEDDEQAMHSGSVERYLLNHSAGQ